MAPRKRGRPRREVSGEILRELTPEDIRVLVETRDRGGRPANRALNDTLLQRWADAKRRGESKREFIREFYLLAGTVLTPDELCDEEHHLNRLLRRL
jgi:hypothetical protein